MIVSLLLVHILVTFCFRTAYVISRNNTIDYHLEYNKKSKLILLAGALVYSFFSATRIILPDGTGGIDAYTYQTMFYSARYYTSLIDFFSSSRMEPLYKVLCYIFCKLFNDFRVFLFVVYFISYICYAYFFKYIYIKREGIISWLGTFVIVAYLFQMFNTLRHGIAISFSMVFFILLEKKRFFLSLLFLAVSSMFHYSALILICPYILYCIFYRNDTIYNNWKNYLLMCFISVLLGVSMAFVFKYILSTNDSYSNSYLSGQFRFMTYFVFIFPLILILINKNKLGNRFFPNIIVLTSIICIIPINVVSYMAYRMLLIYHPVLNRSLLMTTSELYQTNVMKTKIKELVPLMFALVYFLYQIYVHIEYIHSSIYPHTF